MGNGKSSRRYRDHGRSDSGSSEEEDDAPLTISSPKIPRKKVGAVVPPKPVGNSTPAGGSKKKDPRLVGDSAVQQPQADPQLTPKIPRKGVTNKVTAKKDDAVVPPRPRENSSPDGGSKKTDSRLVDVSAVQRPQADPQLAGHEIPRNRKGVNNKVTNKQVDAVVPPKPMKKSSASGSSEKNPPLVGDSAVQDRQTDPQLIKKVVNNESTEKKFDTIIPPKTMKKSSASRSSEKNPPLVGDAAFQDRQADPQLTNETAKSSRKRDSKSMDKKVDTVVPPKPMEKSSAGRSREKNPPLVGDSAVQEPQADPQLTKADPKSSGKRDNKTTDKKVDTVVPPEPMKKSNAGDSCEKTGSRLVDVSAVQDPQLEAVLAEMQRHHHCHCQYVGHGTAAALAENNHHHQQQQPGLGAAAGAEQCTSSSYYKGVVAVDLVPTEASEGVVAADPVRRHKRVIRAKNIDLVVPPKPTKDSSLADSPVLQADPQLEAVLGNMQEQALQADPQLEAVLAIMQRQAPPPAHHRQ